MLDVLKTFAVDIFVRDCGSSTEKHGVIRLNFEEPAQCLQMLNKEVLREDPRIAFKLSPAGVFFYRLYFKAFYSGVFKAPHIRIEIEGEEPRSISLGVFEISSILEAPLLGRSAHENRRIFVESIGGRQKPAFYYVHGNSGTGKSRLLRECRDELLARGFSVYAFNGEGEKNSSYDHFVRRLLSKICKLPLLEPRNHSGTHQVDQVDRERPTGAESLLSMLYDPSCQPSQHTALCNATLLGLLSQRKSAVIIDNLQFFDDTTIEFVNSAISSTLDTPDQTAWLLGINTELISGEMAVNRLSIRLQELSAEFDSGCISLHVSGFSEDEAMLYLDHMISGAENPAERLFSDSHPYLAKLIIKNAGRNPLYLRQALYYVEDQGAIRRSSNQLVIVDIDAFHRSINSLPPETKTLIRKRWEFLKPHLGEEYERLAQALTVLIAAPLRLLQRLGFSGSSVWKLAESGILVVTESDEVHFYHRQLFLYFSEVY
ncbi:MAG TPA: ATP-binding protein, partial [Thermoanaerobaculia bacterium]|nr:ATP-binding protein [Thermoanaerobaculia bacterium]